MRKAAQRENWQTRALPEECAKLNFQASYNRQEYERICLGIIPQDMDNKWFVFVERDVAFFHRSWTGICIYKLSFELRQDRYVVTEALVNRKTEQYQETDNRYDTALLQFLIERFLIEKDCPFPVKKTHMINFPSGVIQHSIAGTGCPVREFNSYGEPKRQYEYTEEQKVEFKREFAAKTRNRSIAIFLFLAAVLFSFASAKIESILGIRVTIAHPLLFVVISCSAIFYYLNWRCPACNRSFGKNVLIPKSCPKCGVPLV